MLSLVCVVDSILIFQLNFHTTNIDYKECSLAWVNINMKTSNKIINLNQWHTSGDYFDFHGQQIFYRVKGEGVPLLLIHGYPTASFDWGKVWPQLSETFHCITLDMLGFGFSDKPQQSYSIFTQADIYCALIKKLGIKYCHIISHDYGDTVAQELLARQNEKTLPFKIKTSHLLNGGIFPETHRPVLMQKLLLSPLGGLLVRLMSKKTLAKNLQKIFGPNTLPSTQEVTDFWSLIRYNNGHLVMHKLISYIVERRVNRARWVGALQHTKIPLRLTNGLFDPISGAHLVTRYQQLIPNADVICLKDIGHYPQIEDPNGVVAAQLDFITPEGVNRFSTQVK